MPKVSIIIPVYNSEKFISECINSVMNQTFEDIECLIINDCTPDLSMDIVAKLLEVYKGGINLRVIDMQNNSGASACRNIGIRESTGQYIYFLDSDDTIANDAIESFVNLADKFNSPDMIVGDLISDNIDLSNVLTIQDKDLPVYTDSQEWLRRHYLLDVPITVWNKLVRRDILVNHNIFFKIGIVNEDILWCADFGKVIKSISFLKSKTYFYRSNVDSVMNSPSNEKNRIRSYMIVLKELLENVEGKDSNVENLNLLKHFYHNKVDHISEKNKVYFNQEFRKKLGEVLNSNKIPIPFKLMYTLLYLPENLLKRMSFFWNKGLGLLYRFYVK